MTPEDVRTMLAKASGEAVATCLAALDQPDTVVDGDATHQHSASTANLLTIYRRRAEHVQELGLPALGFGETVDRLASTPYERLRLVLITGGGGYPWCVVFTAPDKPEPVATLAVLGPTPPR